MSSAGAVVAGFWAAGAGESADTIRASTRTHRAALTDRDAADDQHPVMSLWPLPQYSEHRIGKRAFAGRSEVDSHRFPATRDLLLDFELLDFDAVDAVGGPHHELETLADGRLDLRRLERESSRGDLDDTRFGRLRGGIDVRIATRAAPTGQRQTPPQPLTDVFAETPSGLPIRASAMPRHAGKKPV